MSEENVEIVGRFYELRERGDFPASLAFVDSEIEYVRITPEAPDLAGEWHGVDEMRAATMDYLQVWENYRYEAERFIDLGERVLVLETHRGRGKRSGVEAKRELGALFILRDGLIVRWVHYWDRNEALAAAGL